MLKKLFFFAGWLLLLCLVLLFCFTVGLWLNWTTVTIFMAWLGILVAGIILWTSLLWLTLFIKEKKVGRFFNRFRISRTEYVLFKHWKSGAAIIKRLQRKDPSIPWYILLGDSCGKTSLLASAGLPMYSNSTNENPVVPTHSLRWWFFRNVCFLDLSSNFLSGIPTFNRAWQKLVGRISRMPAPSGIVIGISITDLLTENTNILHDKAHKIRVQIEPLTRKLKRQLPLYIMINQCDKYPSFSLWTQQLSTIQHQQALGYYWQTPQDIDGNDASTLEPLFTALKRGFDLARVSMTGNLVAPEVQCALLHFPETFARLQKPLLVYLASLCESNAHFTPTSLGGVWFTSCEQQDKNKSRRTAYFVHDLLTRHMPMFSTSPEVLLLHHKRWRAGLTCLILMCCMGALGYSAIKSASLMQSNTTKLTPTALAELLVKNERRFHSPLSYILFLPLLNRQHQKLEQQLAMTFPQHDINFTSVLSAYQQQFIVASGPTKRQMVLELAHTIIVRQSMRDGATLESLRQLPAIPAALTLTSIDPPLVRLAIERMRMQQRFGASHLTALQRLLSMLINHDQTLAWLVAPEDSLPALRVSDFWPQATNAQNLSGIWTLQGEEQIYSWLILINQATGNKQTEPALQRFMQTFPSRRQDVWRGLLLSVNSLLHDKTPRSLSQNQLIELSQGQSPAMKFAKYIHFELDNVPAEQAQPWLKELRKLQTLQTLASESATLQKVKGIDTQLRSSLRAWLQNRKVTTAGNTISPQISAWMEWQSSINAAASDALNQGQLSPTLTVGLFVPQTDANRNNPLIAIFSNFDKLQKSLEPKSQKIGVSAVWTLYQSDANTLLAHAVARSGCWLNAEWQSKMMWPMRKNAAVHNYDILQSLTSQYFTYFMQGPAKGMLTVSDQGPQPGQFRGHTFPLTPQFLNIARDMLTPEDMLDVPERQNTLNEDELTSLSDSIALLTQQQKALETKPYKISIISRPTTIPGGARLLPTGARLMLECQSYTRVLDSMNFAEQTQFIWQPGQCQQVTLEVKFPGFNTRYYYKGNSAWPEFLKQFAQSEALLDAQDFEGNTDMLAELGINKILVRFKISNQKTLQHAWLEWLQLDEQIIELTERKKVLMEQHGKLSAPMRGRLSELPENAADCL